MGARREPWAGAEHISRAVAEQRTQQNTHQPMEAAVGGKVHPAAEGDQLAKLEQLRSNDATLYCLAIKQQFVRQYKSSPGAGDL